MEIDGRFVGPVKRINAGATMKILIAYDGSECGNAALDDLYRGSAGQG